MHTNPHICTCISVCIHVTLEHPLNAGVCLSIVFLILKIFLFSFICIYCVRVYTTYVPGAPRGQKRVSNLLELELWVVVNH